VKAKEWIAHFEEVLKTPESEFTRAQLKEVLDTLAQLDPETECRFEVNHGGKPITTCTIKVNATGAPVAECDVNLIGDVPKRYVPKEGAGSFKVLPGEPKDWQFADDGRNYRED
jgi:hypothetical protein